MKIKKLGKKSGDKKAGVLKYSIYQIFIEGMKYAMSTYLIKHEHEMIYA